MGLHDVLVPWLGAVYWRLFQKALQKAFHMPSCSVVSPMCYNLGVTDTTGFHRASPLIVSQFDMNFKNILNDRLSVTQRASGGMKHALSYC